MLLNEYSKQMVSTMLSEGPVVVTFTKKDGTERIMPCTVNQAIVSAKGGGDAAGMLDAANHAVVYDLEINEWRSFRWDSVKTITKV